MMMSEKRRNRRNQERNKKITDNKVKGKEKFYAILAIIILFIVTLILVLFKAMLEHRAHV